MSQSEAHRRLIVATAQAIQQRNPAMQITTDLIENPGDPVPPLIGSYRPDIIARCTTDSIHLVIAEAKTDGDINNRHTRSQIAAFVDHLDSIKNGTGTLILAVNGQVVEKARTVLNFNFRQRVSSRLHIILFDGLDFWALGPPGDTLWRLS